MIINKLINTNKYKTKKNITNCNINTNRCLKLYGKKKICNPNSGRCINNKKNIQSKKQNKIQKKNIFSIRNHKNFLKSLTKNKYGLYYSNELNNDAELIILDKIQTDEYMNDKEGTYFNDDYYYRTITKDCDGVYKDENGNYKVLFRFRKNVITDDLTKIASDSWSKYARKLHDNRGAAAGLLDRKKLPRYVGKLHNPGRFRSLYIGSSSNRLHKAQISNLAPSNIIGYYDKFDRNIGQSRVPCRLTSFTRDHTDLWLKSFPYIKRLNYLFKELTPIEYINQYIQANKTEFVVPKTAYSTITINYNWRTALHRDKGDLEKGFGNLSVVEDGSYTGGCLGFPQFGLKSKNKSINIDVRNGDFLAMDVHQWHCNSEIKPKNKDSQPNRLSIVAYLRKNLYPKCQNVKLQL